MTAYFIVYFILFLFALLERIDDQQINSGKLTNRMLFFSSVLVLVFFGGLRYESGFDYLSYKNIYDNYTGGIPFEPAYCLLMYVFKFIVGTSFPYFLFFYTLLNILVKVLFFQKYFRYPCMLIFLYYPATYLIADFGVMRQAMAIGVFLWAIPAIKENKLLRYLLIWITACCFHYSALIFFPMYWINKLRINQKLFLFLFFAGFLFNYFQISRLIFTMSAKVIPGPLGNLLDYMAGYGFVTENLLYFLRPSTLIGVGLIVIYSYAYRAEISLPDRNSLQYNIYSIYVWFFLIIKYLSSIEVIQKRGSYFYKLLEIFLFYFLLERLKEKELKIIFIIVLFLYGLLRLIDLSLDEFSLGFYDNYRFFYEFIGL